MNTKTAKIAMIVPAAALLLVTFFALISERDVQAAKKKKPTVKELMLAAHKAPKGKKAPLQIVQDQLKSERPDWILIATNAKPLAVLANAIKGTSVLNYKGPTKPYVDGVALLQAAVKKHDLTKGRAAMNDLIRSCVNCHKP